MTLLCFTSSSWQLSNCIPCISSCKVFECNLRCKKFPRFYFLLKYHRSPASLKQTKPTLPSCMVHTFLTWYGSCVQGFFFLQMPDVFAYPPQLCPLFPPLPLVPAWTQGLNQSIMAPGTGAQQCLCAAQRSAALSGSVHLRPGGELGVEREPWCPYVLVSLKVSCPAAQSDPWNLHREREKDREIRAFQIQ